MPLQNNDLLLVNRDSASYKYSVENLKEDIGEDVEAQFNGLEWVAALPSRANQISGAPNVGSTPRTWASVESILLDSTNDVSNVSVGSTVTLTNLSQSQSGTYRVTSVDTGAYTMGVDYESNTGGNIVEGNQFEVRVHRDRFVDKDGDVMNGDLTVPNLISEGDVQTTSLNGGQLAGFRNQLINGNFSIWARGTVVSKSGYGPDRWTCPTGGGETVSEYRRRLRDNCPECPVACEITSTGQTDDYLIQAVELPPNGNPGPFSIGSVWTLSFWANQDMVPGWHQDNALQFRDTVNGDNDINAVSGGNNPPEVIETSATDPNWRRYAIQNLVIDTAPASTNLCLSVRIPLPTTAVRLGQIQLEPGPVATPFEHRPLAVEELLCERYYQHFAPPRYNTSIGFGVGASNTVSRINIPIRTTMRSKPDIGFSNCSITHSGGGAAVTRVAENFSSGSMIMAAIEHASIGAHQNKPAYFILKNDGTFALDAEL